ncbi:hypothetical protein GNY17_02095 [Vibrio parahaemolyticus]|uniref:hypothetical protein n=1 Tax=Vibrio parahaemolyticus TaxID=670 RepID=UPI0003C7A418|nr:hypothetical protein [Vibrio parahaemolyticus]ELA9712821.1 hypothetical protein [Vibrio parahaemolyticus]ELA9726329.1 hypothetical protein [Vibrio parahaemolyticus]MDF4619722.1 hypothetical protein [Vibrio parahaemolyticus]MDF5494824.1 hypothetical protein [Vibrio parahaemolyticus]QGT89755.1 hypothetical protein GNY17_02095 [Vibrio parahaemolyticus]
MAAKKCPRCKYANDFHVNERFEVSCGYCGFVVAQIKEQFQQSAQDCKEKQNAET